jgi:hypothetical protein
MTKQPSKLTATMHDLLTVLRHLPHVARGRARGSR